MSRRIVHAITPGDHYSPRTGSAIPTVVNGLATASLRDDAEPRFEHAVLVDESTYHPRYGGVQIVEYVGADAPSRRQHLTDSAFARLGRQRPASRRYYGPAAAVLWAQPHSIVVAHNALTLVNLLRDLPHTPVLYAHNNIFKTVGKREAGIALDSCAAVVCVSTALATQIAARLPRRLGDRIHVVNNGIDVESFRPRTPERAARETAAEGPVPERAHRLRVVFIARMIRDKGADLLLRAASQLRRDDIEYVIVGSRNFDPGAPLSPFERSLRRIAARSGSHVRFVPFIERSAVAELLRESDILVAPSRWEEPSTLTIGEGMASGLPIIANRVGGIPEVVHSSGILVPNRDPTSIAEAIARLADDPAYRARAGAEARSHAEAHSWDWSWQRLREVLERIA